MSKTLLILLMFFSIIADAQDQHLIDSLQNELNIHNKKKLERGKNVPAMFDTTAATILYQLSKAHWYTNPDESIALAERSKSLSEEINYKKGVGYATYSIGVGYVWKPDLEKARTNTKFALTIGTKIGDKKLIASAYTNLAVISESQSNYPEALKNYFTALKLAEAIDEKEIQIWNYLGITNTYNILENYNEALKSALAGLKVAEALGDKIYITQFYFDIGYNYSEFGRYAESVSYNQLALQMSKELNDNYGINQAYRNLGIVSQKQGNYSNALKYYFLNLQYADTGEDNIIKAFALNKIGEVYLMQKNYINSIKFLTEALDLAMENGNLELMKFNVQYLSDAYNGLANSPLTPFSEKLNFSQKALENYKLFIVYRDSMLNIESAKKITQQQMQFEFDKKEALAKAEQDKKHALAVAEIQKQKVVRNFSLAGIFMIIFIGSYGFYRFRENKRIENQGALLNERLRISRELHDDMGSTLSSISVYSEVAKNRAAKNENETEVLQKIGTASRELIEKMSDIVWSLNPNNENFEQLKNRMMAFAAMMLTPKEILFEFDIDNEVEKIALAPEQRKNIFLIYKEAINNIVKYSEASAVTVKVNGNENNLSLVISDNGKGFDPATVVAYNGNGLKSMRARAQEIKAVFNITSGTNKGVKIDLSFQV